MGFCMSLCVCECATERDKHHLDDASKRYNVSPLCKGEGITEEYCRCCNWIIRKCSANLQFILGNLSSIEIILMELHSANNVWLQTWGHHQLSSPTAHSTAEFFYPLPKAVNQQHKCTYSSFHYRRTEFAQRCDLWPVDTFLLIGICWAYESMAKNWVTLQVWSVNYLICYILWFVGGDIPR